MRERISVIPDEPVELGRQIIKRKSGLKDEKGGKDKRSVKSLKKKSQQNSWKERYLCGNEDYLQRESEWAGSGGGQSRQRRETVCKRQREHEARR